MLSLGLLMNVAVSFFTLKFQACRTHANDKFMLEHTDAVRVHIIRYHILALPRESVSDLFIFLCVFFSSFGVEQHSPKHVIFDLKQPTMRFSVAQIHLHSRRKGAHAHVRRTHAMRFYILDKTNERIFRQ